MDITGIMVTTIVFLSIVVIWGGILLTRHRERMTVIEKGLGAEDIKALYQRQFSKMNPLASLKWGIIFVGVGLAVLLGMWLHANYYVQEGVIPGLIALFGGLALIIFYVIAGRKHQD